jgi:hypothetical protein
MGFPNVIVECAFNSILDETTMRQPALLTSQSTWIRFRAPSEVVHMNWTISRQALSR